MRFFRVVDLVCSLLLISLSSVSNAGSVNLPSYPLAVKSPYLSTWVPGNQLKDAATAQPEFWAGQVLTWTVLARINGVTYALFGDPSAGNATAATTTSVTYTSSHTVVELTAGDADITLDFFSPVLPGTEDYARQALPYSYLTVSVSCTTDQSRNIQILSAIDQTWTAQDGAANLNYTTSGTAGFFWFYNPDEIPFTEVSDMATYGSVLFATTTGSGVTHACNTPSQVYGSFATNGSLITSTACANTDLAALSKNLGSVHGSSNVTFAVGLDRVQAIDYLGNTQTGYYRSEWPTVPEAIQYFLGDYETALSTSNSFDEEVRSRSESVSSTFGSQYADIVEASVRQTFGAIELTVCEPEAKIQDAINLRASQVPVDDLTCTPSVFLKEISSDGNVNTVDLIFQSWPIFISLNPTYIRYLFQPIISYLETGDWPEPYVVHDLGSGMTI